MQVRVADVWANYWPRTLFDAYSPLDDLYTRLGFEERTSFGLDELRRDAELAGAEWVVLSGTAFPTSPSTNDAVAEAAAACPDLVVACASVDPREGMAAVRELRRAVEELGCRGVKLLPFLYDLPPSDAVYYPLYAACVELDVPVLVLTGHTAVARPNDLGQPQHLDKVALHFPELTIVAGHAGYPWTDELIGLAWKHEQLFIDTSGHLPRHWPPQLVRFADSYGSHKVLFGTGWPLFDISLAARELDTIGLGEQSLERIRWSNAAKVWGWS